MHCWRKWTKMKWNIQKILKKASAEGRVEAKLGFPKKKKSTKYQAPVNSNVINIGCDHGLDNTTRKKICEAASLCLNDLICKY